MAASQLPQKNIVVAFSMGPAWYHAGQTQTVLLQPNFANTYQATTPKRQLTYGELFIGGQRAFSQWGLGQLGIAVAASTHAVMQGVIWEMADPEFDNYAYQYKLSHARLAVKTKWLLTHWSSRILPYLSASLGVAENNSHDFVATPLIFEALTVPGFMDHKVNALTYTLGAGIHTVLSTHWQFGIGYEFSDWGHSSLGLAPAQSVNQSLRLNHLQVQQLQLILNYLF